MRKNGFGIVAMLVGFLYCILKMIPEIMMIIGIRGINGISKSLVVQSLEMGGPLGIATLFTFVLNLLIPIIGFMWLIFIAGNKTDYKIPINITIIYCVLTLVQRLFVAWVNAKGHFSFQTVKDNGLPIIMDLIVISAWVVHAKWKSRGGKLTFMILRFGLLAFGFIENAEYCKRLLEGKFVIDTFDLIFGIVTSWLGWFALIFLVLYLVFPRIFTKSK